MASNESFQLYGGPFVFDTTSLAGILVDLVAGGMRRLRREQPGFGEVAMELEQSVPIFGAAAGIPQDVYAQLLTCTGHITQIRAARAMVTKLDEVLEESEAKYEHDRENCISLIVDSIKSAARRKDASILAPFEKTIRYCGQVAEKALRTRRKNAQEAEQPAEAPPPSAPQ